MRRCLKSVYLAQHSIHGRSSTPASLAMILCISFRWNFLSVTLTQSFKDSLNALSDTCVFLFPAHSSFFICSNYIPTLIFWSPKVITGISSRSNLTNLTDYDLTYTLMFCIYIFYHVLDFKLLEGRIHVYFSILYVLQHPILGLKTTPSRNSVKNFWMNNEWKFTTLAWVTSQPFFLFLGPLFLLNISFITRSLRRKRKTWEPHWAR